MTQDRINTISVLANNPEFQKTYRESLVADKNLKNIYETKLEKIENEIFANSGRELELREATDRLANGKITQKEFSEIIKKGEDSSISFKELERKVGKETSDYVKNAVKKRTELYYKIYFVLPKEKNLDINEYKVEEELFKILSPRELENLNKCIGQGGNFGSCFDKHYTHVGLKTFLCIKDKRYCPTMTPYQFNKMRTK